MFFPKTKKVHRRESVMISALDELGFNYTLKKSSRRRTLALQVRQAEVILSAPYSVSEGDAHQWLRQKQAWVGEKLLRQQQRAKEQIIRQYVEGETFLFLGEPYTLHIGQAQADLHERVLRDEVTRQLTVYPNTRSRRPIAQQLASYLEQWYRQQALSILREKTEALVCRLGLKFGELKVKRTRSKWGHCTSRGDIQYNWLILMAPEAVVDYLVAHEVSHLKYPHHRADFWRQVEALCEDYPSRRAWLKKNGYQLVL